MMLGRDITMPIETVIPRPRQQSDDQVPDPVDYVYTLQENLIKAHETARKNLKQNANFQKKYYDTKARHRLFQEGQPV